MEYQEHALQDLFRIDGIVNARRLHCSRDWQFEGDRHSCWELQYMADGNTFVHLNNRFYRLQKGELILFRPDSFHVVYADGEAPAEMWVISFSSAGNPPAAVGRGIFSVSARCEALLREILETVEDGFRCSERTDVPELLQRRQTAPPGNDQLIRIRLEQVLLLLMRAAEGTGAFAGWRGLQETNGHAFLAERIRSFMLQRVEGRLCLEQVARAFYISESMVKTVYKQRFGISLIADYHRQKAERARLLLCRQDLTIGQIAAMLGFETPYYFSNFFKKHMGVAPSAYRKSLE